MISPDIYDELALFRDVPIRCETEPTDMIRYLVDQGYLTASDNIIRDLSIIPIEWTITVDGRVALSEYERVQDEMRKHETEKKAQQRFQNKVSIAQLLIPVITFILGLLIERFSGIISLLSKFFQ